MARSYPLALVVPSGAPGTPAQLHLSASAGDVSASFHGRYYRNDAGLIEPGYLVAPSPGYSLIAATAFEVVSNSSYVGRYIVYTPISVGDAGVNPSSIFTAGQTILRVNEVVGPPSAVGDDVNTGFITNISTYLFEIEGESDLIVSPTVNLDDRPIEIVGRNGAPWGEAYTKNMLRLAQNFAGNLPPANPYLGQTWYDVGGTLMVFNGTSWVALGGGGGSVTQSIAVACSDEVTPLVAGTTIKFRVPYDFTLTGLKASLTTAQTSGTLLTVDLNRGASSLLSTKITFDNGETTTKTAVTQPVIVTSALLDDDELEVEIDSIGDGTATGLKVYLIGFAS